MFDSLDQFLLPLLSAIGMFALVGLVWNLAEGLFEEERKDQR